LKIRYQNIQSKIEE